MHGVLESFHVVDELPQPVIAPAAELDSQLAQCGNGLAFVHQVEAFFHPGLS
jgi:hypothetical protein